MKKWVILMISVLILAACEAPGIMSNSQKENKIAVTQMIKLKDIQYVALGDSLTEGVGDELDKEGYVGRMKKEMETWRGVKSVTVTNTAKRGRRSDQLIDQIQSGEIDDALEQADIISLTIGGNDLMKIVRSNITDLTKEVFDDKRPAFQQRYETIMQLIRERNPNAPIILIGVYNPLSIFTKEKSDMNTIMREWNSDIRGFANQDGHAVFINVVDLFDSNDNMVYHTDFFHPNAKGYDQMTARIIKTLHEVDLKKLSHGQFDFKEDSTDE
ncbi:GDSL-type esterase/lipase family protein [Rummeliibacillus sp. NPDC094406]|uniref:GDSL-type esterase/lipase family protein n=1 Tax=Rummeliibacillus sp. NPDC094406 TaxID=3364511 RepID=UPI00381A66EB